MNSLEKWKHCVVNLEFRSFNGESPNIRTGTAILINYKNHYFLATASHLLLDNNVRSDIPIYQRLVKQIMRVPLFDELNDETKRKKITKNIFFKDGRLFWQRQYPGFPYKNKGEDIASPKFIELSESTDPNDSALTISENNDLAVISLRPRLSELLSRIFMNDSIFVEELLMLGYNPISIDEIGLGPSYEGADIFTVGYPSDVSHVMTREEIKGKYEEYFSIDVTIPCFTFGKVSMVNTNLQYFWADLRIYYGNSGSPVIENNKLVGIVTHHAIMEAKDQFLIIPFAKATKAEFFTNPETLPRRFPNHFLSPEDKEKLKRSGI